MKTHLFFLSVILFYHTTIFGQEVIKKELSISVDQAVKKLQSTLKSKGMTVFKVINHQKAAQKSGLTMNPSQVIIFGNPKVGTELMNSNIQWSYELPLKIAIYQDNQNKVWAQSRTLTKDIWSPDQTQRINNMNNLVKELLNIQ